MPTWPCTSLSIIYLCQPVTETRGIVDLIALLKWSSVGPVCLYSYHAHSLNWTLVFLNDLPRDQCFYSRSCSPTDTFVATWNLTVLTGLDVVALLSDDDDVSWSADDNVSWSDDDDDDVSMPEGMFIDFYPTRGWDKWGGFPLPSSQIIMGEKLSNTPAGSGLELFCCSLLHVVRGD